MFAHSLIICTSILAFSGRNVFIVRYDVDHAFFDCFSLKKETEKINFFLKNDQKNT